MATGRPRRSPPVRKGGYTKENISGWLKHLAKELGHTPTVREIVAHGPPSPATIYVMFHTLSEAMKYSGLTPNPQSVTMRFTNDELLNHLRTLAQKLGHSPSANDIMTVGNRPSVHTYRVRFGSLNAAQEAAGLEKTRQGKPRGVPRKQKPPEDEMLPEYDFSKGVRNKYATRLRGRPSRETKLGEYDQLFGGLPTYAQAGRKKAPP